MYILDVLLVIADEVRMSLVRQEESLRGSPGRSRDCRREIHRYSDADDPNISSQNISWKILFVFQIHMVRRTTPI